MKLTTIPFILALATSLGCGGSEPSGGTDAPAPDPEPRADLCSLLTASDIEESLGKLAGDPAPGDEGLGQCAWGSEPAVRLTLETASLSSFDDFVVVFGEEFGGEDPPREQFHPVDGVGGDWAMYVAEHDMVRAFRGGQVLEVSSVGAEEAQVVDLATRAMARLP